MTTIPLDIMKVREDENHRVMIIGRDTQNEFLTSTNGIRLVEFAVGGSNEFQSLFELASQQDLQNKLSQIKAVTDTVAGFFGSDFKLPDLRLKRLEQTRLTWISSATPLFVVQLLFIALRPGDDVRQEVMNLQKSVFPVIKENTIKPPLGVDSNQGRFNVHIGKWFRAVNQVIRKVEFIYSRELVSPGDVTSFPSPLYAVGAVTFSPYELPSADIMRSYFPEVT